jgi:hypothetical protein
MTFLLAGFRISWNFVRRNITKKNCRIMAWTCPTHRVHKIESSSVRCSGIVELMMMLI